MAIVTQCLTVSSKIEMVHPGEAYVDLKKCGHSTLIWSCCTMDLGFVATVT